MKNQVHPDCPIHGVLYETKSTTPTPKEGPPNAEPPLEEWTKESLIAHIWSLEKQEKRDEKRIEALEKVAFTVKKCGLGCDDFCGTPRLATGRLILEGEPGYDREESEEQRHTLFCDSNKACTDAIKELDKIREQ